MLNECDPFSLYFCRFFLQNFFPFDFNQKSTKLRPKDEKFAKYNLFFLEKLTTLLSTPLVPTHNLFFDFFSLFFALFSICLAITREIRNIKYERNVFKKFSKQILLSYITFGEILA